MNSILGRVNYDVENCSGVLTVDKKKLLKNLGVKKWDFSHYTKGSFKLISKKKLSLMQKVINSDIVSSGQFLPLNSEKEFKAEIILIERGLIK